jgi:hypothetical protein
VTDGGVSHARLSAALRAATSPVIDPRAAEYHADSSTEARADGELEGRTCINSVWCAAGWSHGGGSGGYAEKRVPPMACTNCDVQAGLKAAVGDDADHPCGRSVAHMLTEM